MKVAAVDLGTNTLRLLIGDWTGQSLERVIVRRAIVRLGQGLRNSGAPAAGAVDRTESALKEFGSIIRRAGVSRVLAVGTSALRDLCSHPGLLLRLEEALGFKILVISGEDEAAIMARGVQAGIGPVDDGLIMDIGGGSTEFVRVRRSRILWHRSVPEGVVHLTEEFLRSDPPTPRQAAALRDRFRSILPEDPDGGVTLAGTAGTPTTMAALDLGIDVYDPGLVNGHVLLKGVVTGLCDRLLGMTSAERLRLPGMERGREDLIAAGVLMAVEAMARWGFNEMVVSDWGLLEGLAIEAATRP